jgi:glycosyltransferase involved in cell wall biosynthesis
VRVLLVSNFYPPYWVGGYEQIAAWVARGLQERGHEVEVLTGRGAAFEGREGIRPELDLDLQRLWETYFTTGIVFRNGLAEGLRRHVFSGRNYSACLRAVRRFRADLVSFWNPAFVTVAPLLAARRAGVPAIAHLSDTVANPFRNPHPPRFPEALRGLARHGVDLLLRAARPARVVVPSAFLARKLGRTEAIAPERLEVLHWPVEPTVSALAAAPTRDGPPRRILFVGTLIPEKGPEVLLGAFATAQARQRDLSLTFVGGGPEHYVQRLKALAAGLPVRFLGRQDRAEVVAAYASHDILAFPSVWDEPFAVVPLEAMAMGLAVVATTAGGTPEAVEDGATGLLVPPGDEAALAAAILTLTADPGGTRALAARGRRWALEQQGFPVFMERLEDLYQRVAREGRAR